MTRPAIGFYWTLPVPWAGFTALPSEPEAAAKLSRTIRYQREVVGRYARENGFELLDERVFLEVDPDRVSEQMWEALSAVREELLESGAILLVVDFAEVHGMRRNLHMERLAADADVQVLVVPPDPVILDGSLFDPAIHFTDWRRKQRAWTSGKADRIKAAVERARFLKSQGGSLSEIAEQLNNEGLKSATGKPWTAESLRKTFKAADSEERLNDRCG